MMDDLEAKKAYETGLEGNKLPEDQKPTEAIRAKIISLLKKLKIEPDDITLKLNVPFWVQALRDNINARLNLDIVEKKEVVIQSVIPVRKDRDTEGHETKLRYYLQNYQEIFDDFAGQKSYIEKTLETGNLVIMTNHSS